MTKIAHTYLHMCIHTYIMPTYIYTYIHIYIHTYIHTYIHAYIHTYTHSFSFDVRLYCKIGHKTYQHNLDGALKRLMIINLAGILRSLYVWPSMLDWAKYFATYKEVLLLYCFFRTLFKWLLNVNDTYKEKLFYSIKLKKSLQ